MSSDSTNRAAVLAKLCEGLAHLPDVRIEQTPGSITVHPQSPDGFVVSLEVGARECVISLEGWHDHFTDDDEAIAFFGLALSVDARLAITYRGQKPVAWTFEVLEGERWRPIGTTSLMFVPFWRRKHVVYRRNALVGADGSEHESDAE